MAELEQELEEIVKGGSQAMPTVNLVFSGVPKEDDSASQQQLPPQGMSCFAGPQAETDLPQRDIQNPISIKS